MSIGRSILFFSFIIFTFSACGQLKNNRFRLGRSYAEQELNVALHDKDQYNVINDKTVIIKDSTTAVAIAEPVLFSIYGKKNITSQQPYECYFINNYWVIGGTLPEGYKGGTFLIILDARDCRVLRLTHGK